MLLFISLNFFHNLNEALTKFVARGDARLRGWAWRLRGGTGNTGPDQIWALESWERERRRAHARAPDAARMVGLRACPSRSVAGSEPARQRQAERWGLVEQKTWRIRAGSTVREQQQDRCGSADARSYMELHIRKHTVISVRHYLKKVISVRRREHRE